MSGTNKSRYVFICTNHTTYYFNKVIVVGITYRYFISLVNTIIGKGYATLC